MNPIARPAEPFGDLSKRHARLNVLQRSVEIICKGVTNGGVITGDMFVGGGDNMRDFSLEMVGAGLAAVDQRKIDYGEASQTLVNAQNRALANKVGIWSLHQEKREVRNAASSHRFPIELGLYLTLFSFLCHVRLSSKLFPKQRKRPPQSDLVKFVPEAISSSMLLVTRLPRSLQRVCVSLQQKMEQVVLLVM